jgi:hypothetical protein
MNVRQLIGILVILGAYGLTWYLLLKSMAIVKMIDREGLNHAGEIKARLKRRGAPGVHRGPGSSDGDKK